MYRTNICEGKKKERNMKEFKKVIGYEDVKIELERIVDMMINPDKYSKLGVTTTRGLLLYGDPGVGKTLMAKCLIKASKRKAYTVRKDIPDGEFVKYIKETFEKAKKTAPSIVFLDDMDKFANGDRKHRNTEEFVTIQSCIDDVKEFEVFVLATANDLDCVPESLLRAGRFDKNILVKNPTGVNAAKIVKHYLKKKKVDKDLDYAEIVRFLDGRSCAALETVINEAGVYSGYEGRDFISNEDIIRSFMRVVYDAPENIDDTDCKFLRNISVHEAGHAVVGEILEPGSVSFITVKKHDSSTRGFTSLNNNDDYFYDISFMENRIITLLAGKAATEIVYGKPDVGCTEDIERAISILFRFVNDYGVFGFSYCAGEKFDDNISSKEVYSQQATIIQSQMDKYYQRARKILIDNRDFLERLTVLLEEKKTITYKDIQKVKTESKLNLAFC